MSEKCQFRKSEHFVNGKLMVFRSLQTPQFVENALQQYNYDCSTCFVHYYRRERERKQNQLSIIEANREEGETETRARKSNQNKMRRHREISKTH